MRKKTRKKNRTQNKTNIEHSTTKHATDTFYCHKKATTMSCVICACVEWPLYLSHCWMFLFIFSCLTYWFVRRLKMDFFFNVLQISMLISATMSHHFWNPNQKYEQTRAYILRYIACVNVIQLKNALTLEIAHRVSSKRNIDKFHNGILCIVRTKPINGIVQVKRERENEKKINNLNRRLIVAMLKNAARMLFQWDFSFRAKIFRPFFNTMHRTKRNCTQKYEKSISTSFQRRINDKPIKIAKMVWHRINWAVLIVVAFGWRNVNSVRWLWFQRYFCFCF